MGGIKKGETAYDEISKAQDKFIKKASNELSIKYKQFSFKRKLDQSEIPGGIGACEPDGGLFYINNKLVVVFEMKKQNNEGNAIERWFKNNYICRKINPDVSYVTFACGGGTVENGIILKTLNIAHLDGINKFVKSKNSLFTNITGFTKEEIYDKMDEILKELINE
jgi:hypothetical protein